MTKRLVAAVFTGLWLNPALGAEDIFERSVTLKLGAMYNSVDADVVVAVDPLPETAVDLDTLGIDDTSTEFWVSADWRISQRWILHFIYNGFDESGNAVVDESFNFDGQIYPVGANIQTDFKANAYIVNLTYSLFQGDNYELGAGLGVHAFEFEAGVSGSFEVPGSIETFEANSDDLIAPVPNVRVFGDYLLGKNTLLGFTAGWLGASYEDYDGSFVYASARLEYYFGDYWLAGLGYQYTDVDLEHDPGGRSREEYEMAIDSVSVYVGFSW